VETGSRCCKSPFPADLASAAKARALHWGRERIKWCFYTQSNTLNMQMGRRTAKERGGRVILEGAQCNNIRGRGSV
jgi:hypothetical protein